MSSHVYHEIFLHLNWHTKLDRPLLRGELEKRAQAAIRNRCRDYKGAYLHELGGTDDHVHLAISIEPFVTISELLQNLKGGSSHDVNEERQRKTLEWQRGYGAVSFGKAHLGWVAEYIRNQREHHAKRNLQVRLETFDQNPLSGE